MSAPDAAGDLGYDWSGVEIGGGGFVTGLVTGPTGEVYSRSDVGGAYRWDDVSQSWEQMLTASGVPGATGADYQVESLAVAPSDGDVVYVAVGNTLGSAKGRVLRSDDGGRTWRDGGHRFVIKGNEPWKWGGERLSVDPANPDVVQYGTRTQGLWRSEDGGLTWAQTTVPYPAWSGTGSPAGIGVTVFDPASRVVDGQSQTAWAGSTGRGVFRTDDGGDTWTVVHAMDAGVPRDAEFGPDGRLYVVVQTSTSYVARIDPASSVVDVVGPTTKGKLATIAVDPHKPGRIFLGESGVKDGALWQSNDGGTTWSWRHINLSSVDAGWTAGTGIDGWMSTGEMTFDPSRPGLLWFAEGMGVWSTTDLSDSSVGWKFTSRGIEALVSNDAVKPKGQPLLTAHWDRPVLRHSDSGADLALTKRFDAAWDLDVADHDPSFVAAVVDDNRFLGDPLAAQSGYSTDGGATWQRFGSLVAGTHPAGLAFGNIAVSTGNNDNIVWVPSRGAKIHHSTDRGATWQLATYPGTEPHFAYYLGRRVLTADAITTGTFYVLDAKGLMRSTDGGATWTKMAGTGLPPSSALRYNATLEAVPGRAGELFLSVGHLKDGAYGLLRSTDGGETWTKLAGIDDVGTFGFGAPATQDGPPVLFATAELPTKGLWRSDDLGATWRHLTTAPRGLYGTIKVVAGDPDVVGKVYIGFSGTGFVAGVPTTAPTTTVAPAPAAPAPTTVAPAPTKVAPAPVAPAPTTVAPAPVAPAPTTVAPTPTKRAPSAVAPAPTRVAPAPTSTKSPSTTKTPTPTTPTTEGADPSTKPAERKGSTKKKAGFLTVSRTGRVTGHGEMTARGSLTSALAGPIVAVLPTATEEGYWLVGSDGGVFSFGDARFHGSTGATRLNRPIIGMAATPSGNGYWLVASDGGVFSFGDARFHGSTGGIQLNKPIIGVAATPSGNGYWLVASDGGVFSFGDARFHGSTGHIALHSPLVGVAVTPTGDGYWMVAEDGGVFGFGDAEFHGSASGTPLRAIGMSPSPSGRGYWIIGSKGEVVGLGDAARQAGSGQVAGAAVANT